MRRSRRCCCRRPVYRRIPRPVAFFMCVTITPMCNSGSTVSCCPTASAVSAASSIPISSAALRSSPARFPPNSDYAPSVSSTSPRAATFSIIRAASTITSAAGRGFSRASNMAAPLAPTVQAQALQCRPKRRHRHRRRASAACNIISRAVICRPTRASKTRCHFSIRSMTSRGRNEALPIYRPSSIRIPA